MKWRKMLGPDGVSFEAYKARKPAKVKRRARKGIPEEMRGLAWQLMSGASHAHTPLGPLAPS